MAIATASNFGNIRRKSFLKHHTAPNEMAKRNRELTEFDQLTWLLTQYKAMEEKMAKVPYHNRKTYNTYFTKYVSNLIKLQINRKGHH